MTINKKEEMSFTHLSNDDLLKYHRKQLPAEENLIVENHLKQCEFCSDALKGLAEMNNDLHIYTITKELRKRMYAKLKPKQRIFSRFDIFTILLVLFILGLIIFLAFYFLIAKIN